MREFSGVKTIYGDKMYSNEYIQHLRNLDRKKPNPLKIIAQAGAQEQMLSQLADILIVGGSRGGAKGQDYDSQVVTPFGYRKIGDLKVGDTITDVNGCMQKVVCITELGNREIYKLNFSDGTSVRCTNDHLWKIKRTNFISKKRVLNGTGQDDDWRLWTFDMIKEYLDSQQVKIQSQKSNLLIPLCEPVKFTKSYVSKYKPKTDYYVIGALLGDGCITDNVLVSYSGMLTCMDDEIVENIKGAGVEVYDVRDKKKTKAKSYYFKDEQMKADLYGLGLAGKNSHDKFIPEQMMYSTVENRLALIQGLMDTDGTIDSRGHCSFSTVSKQLAEDVAFVLRSLGAYVTISESKAGYKKDGKYVECSNVFNLYIKIKDCYRLFRLSRKKERSRKYNGGVSTPTKRIVSYDFVGYDKARCIAVSNPTALYLTEDFTVTHNSFTLLMEALKDINDPHFSALILRNERADLLDLVNTSYLLYKQFGVYNKSQSDMTWNFNAGGKLKFSYYSDEYEEFKKRFQGKQYSFIGIDEITHSEYRKFKYLITCNRNASGIRNRFWGTCNPDPESWVRTFIDWWVGEDGYIIPERNGKVRYCFMDGDTPNSIYWGDTPEEVYEQCKDIIDPLWNDSFEELGFNKITMFVKSVVFIRAGLEENIKLIASDPNYAANLAQQDEEQRMRDLRGNWNFKNSGDDLIKMEDMEGFFNNCIMNDNGTLYATCDIAFQGGDSLVMWLWEGWHVKDLFVCRNDAKTAISMVKEKLAEWGVSEKNFTYDLQGIGQTFKAFFPEALGFNNQEAPIPTSSVEKSSITNLYKNLKSQCAFLFATKIKKKEMSISQELLELKFSGDGFEKVPLRNILQKERKAIRRNEETADKGFTLINKKTMKKYVGHSPDYIESLIFRVVFDLKRKHTKPRGLWMI